MFKRINNWHLSVLVAIVSIFSIALIQQYASAQWVEPGDFPGSSALKSFVFSPMEDDLDLGGFNIISSNVDIYADGDGNEDLSNTTALAITGSKNFCLNGDCKSAWPGAESDDIKILNTHGAGDHTIPMFTGSNTIGNSKLIQNNELNGPATLTFTGGVVIDHENHTIDQPLTVYDNINDYPGESNPTPFVITKEGRVGIGTASPNTSASTGLLHIRAPSGNAEINLQSGSGIDHWAIVDHNVSQSLDFWHGDNTNGGINIMKLNDSGVTIAGNLTASGVICDSTGCIDGIGSGYWTGDTQDNLKASDSDAFFLAMNQSKNSTTGLLALAEGEGTRMIWYPYKSAFRAGILTSGNPTAWDDANIGVSSVAFGKDNKASGLYSATLGGNTNTASGESSVIAGGGGNIAAGLGATIGGGLLNLANPNGATVSGGTNNKAYGFYSMIGGGGFNNVSSTYSVISGGQENELAGSSGVISGGYQNLMYGDRGSIGGGWGNSIRVNTTGATIAGGLTNTVTAIGLKIGATIGGGGDNSIGGMYATIPGGQFNIADGDYSFAAGENMQLTSSAYATFAWGNSLAPVSISRAASFLIFPTDPPGGDIPRVGIGTTNPNSTLHVKANTGNAELDIQSGGSDGQHWGIYQDGADGDLNFWHGTNNVIFSDDALVIEKPNTKDVRLDFLQTGIARYTMGIDDSDGVKFKVGNSTGGKLPFGTDNWFEIDPISIKTIFKGDLGVESDATDGVNNYIQVDQISGAPLATDCNELSENGRMIFDGSTSSLWICNNSVWEDHN